MGCGASAIYAESECSNTERVEVNTWQREWKVLKTIGEAQKYYKEIGALPEKSKPAYVELLTVLNDSASHQLLNSYAKQHEHRLIIACWSDIERLRILSEKYAFQKGSQLYIKYIKNQPEGLIKYVPLQEDGVENCKKIFEDPLNHGKIFDAKQMMDLFHWLQIDCIVAMYNLIYLPFKSSPIYQQMIDELRKRYNQVLPDDFDYLCKLGDGAYGIVVKCRKKSTGKIYAMKVQRKTALASAFEAEPWRVDYEKKTYSMCQHPYLVDFAYSFQMETLCMIVMGLCSGGDMAGLLASVPDNRLDEEHVNFYAAEIAAGLSYLHDMGLIYRDLKPGNILLNDDGHIKLADLGGVRDISGETISQYDESENLAPIFNRILSGIGLQLARTRQLSLKDKLPAACYKSKTEYDDVSHLSGAANVPYEALPKCRSIVGTHGYMAPEVVELEDPSILSKDGYTFSADWFSFGATIYRLYTGSRPFAGQQVKKTALRKSMSNSPNTAHLSTSIFDDSNVGFERPAAYKYEIPEEGVEYDPNIFTPRAVDLIEKLLNFDPSKRLGSGKTLSGEVLSHPYFEDIDWCLLERKLIPAPPLPERMTSHKTLHGPGVVGVSSIMNQLSLSKKAITDANETSRTVGTPHRSLGHLMKTLGYSEWLEDDCDEIGPYFETWNCVATNVIKEEYAADQKRQREEAEAQAEAQALAEAETNEFVEKHFK